MLAGTTYYVHVYTSSNGQHIKSQEVQTASYPDFTTNALPTQYDDTDARPFGNKPSWENYALGLSVWKTDPDDETSGFKTIEAIKDEMNLVPLRYLSVLDFEKTSWYFCPGGTELAPYITNTSDNYQNNVSLVIIFSYSSASGLSYGVSTAQETEILGSVALNRSQHLPAAKRNQVIDAMLSTRFGNRFYITMLCLDELGGQHITPSHEWNFSYVTD